jgi:hypothetical protein
MVKVLIGWMDQEHGTAEASPSGGLTYAVPDPDRARPGRGEARVVCEVDRVQWTLVDLGCKLRGVSMARA